MQLGVDGVGGVRGGGGDGFDRKVDAILHHLQDRGLIVEGHDLRAGEYLGVAELLKRPHRGLDAAVGIVPQGGGNGQRIEGQGAGSAQRHQRQRVHGRAGDCRGYSAAGGLEQVGRGDGQIFPIDAALKAVAEGDLHHGRFDQHLTMDIFQHRIQEFFDPFVLAGIGKNAHQARLPVHGDDAGALFFRGCGRLTGPLSHGRGRVASGTTHDIGVSRRQGARCTCKRLHGRRLGTVTALFQDQDRQNIFTQRIPELVLRVGGEGRFRLVFIVGACAFIVTVVGGDLRGNAIAAGAGPRQIDIIDLIDLQVGLVRGDDDRLTFDFITQIHLLGDAIEDARQRLVDGAQGHLAFNAGVDIDVHVGVPGQGKEQIPHRHVGHGDGIDLFRIDRAIQNLVALMGIHLHRSGHIGRGRRIGGS